MCHYGFYEATHKGKVASRHVLGSSHLQLTIVWVLCLLGGLVGCSGTIIDQMESLSGVRTEDLRDMVRDDIGRQRLLIFVHGFNSSKNTAWGRFPDLLQGDPDFADFNIHRFGYPTNRCRQVSDIRNQGEFLASYLNSVLASDRARYREVVLVGHSMGGLVILHALLKLERDNYTMLKGVDLKVLTFGTPYFGVQNTEALSIVCDNRQVKDMAALNDALGVLGREWSQRFNQPSFHGTRDTPQIPLYTFRATEDRFVTATSACGPPQAPCESVDGDHNSIVKPESRAHLSYQKLRQVVARAKIPPTAAGNVGIWIARLTGDDSSHSSQRSIARSLEFYISREGAQLQDAVEIRELPVEILGTTLKEKEFEVKAIGQEQRASIVIWGDVAKLAGVEQLHPRVTLINPLKIPVTTTLLAPVTHLTQQQYMGRPPETVSVPPEPLREPIQLARFVAAVTFMGRQEWAKGAQQLEEFIDGGLATAVRAADVYFYAGVAYFSMFQMSGNSAHLAKTIDYHRMASTIYQDASDWDQTVIVLNNLGFCYQMLSLRSDDQVAKLKLSVETLQEAARISENHSNWTNYAAAKNHLGLTYLRLAERGEAQEQNITRSVDELRTAVRIFKEQENAVYYPVAQNNLGLAYQAMANHGMSPEENIERSITALTESVRLLSEQENVIELGIAQMNLALAYRSLALRGVAIEVNLTRGMEGLIEASRYNKKQNHLAGYAATQNSLGLIYQGMANHGIEPEGNLKRAIEVLSESADLLKEQGDVTGYATVQNNIGLTYSLMAQLGITPKENLSWGIQALMEASRISMEHNNWAVYALVQNNLGEAYRELANWKEEPKESLDRSSEALKEAVRLLKEQKDWGIYPVALNNLGLVHLNLAKLGSDIEANLRQSIESFTEVGHFWAEQRNMAYSAVTHSNLGLAYQALANSGIDPEPNFQRSVEAQTEAANLWKDQESWESYSASMENIGLIYWSLVERQVSPEENFSHSIEALSEAARLRRETKKWIEYAKIQKSLGMVYRLGAMQGIVTERNLKESIKPFKEASHLFKEQENWSSYASTQNELALTYLSLANAKESSQFNLALAIDASGEASRVLKEHSNMIDYALVQGNLGVAYRLLAEEGVMPEANFTQSVNTLKGALFILKEQTIWDQYVEFLIELGRTHESSAGRVVQKSTHEQAAHAAYEEAVAVGEQRNVRIDLVKVASTRLKALQGE